MEAKENLGICATCNDLDTCLNRSGNGKVTWFCEDFDNEVTIRTKPPSAGVQPAAEVANEGLYFGLCKECDHKTTCMHAKTPGGIWFCNDYA